MEIIGSGSSGDENHQMYPLIGLTISEAYDNGFQAGLDAAAKWLEAQADLYGVATDEFAVMQTRLRSDAVAIRRIKP